MGFFTFMAKNRESRDWYDKTIRAIAQRKDLPFYDRMNYCYQTLLNFMLKYDTRQIGRDRSWLIAWSKFIRENTLYAIASNFEGDFPTLYWSVMLLEARHYVVDSYFLFLERKREQHAKFYEPRREILMKHGVIQAMQDLVDDKLDLLTISAPPGSGKLLADDTPVLTTDGWKNHGDLKVGDYVYGLDGKPKRVLHVFPKDMANCVVEFTNGETVYCHENHEWVVFDRSTKEERIVETKYLFTVKLDSGVDGKRGHRYRFQLPSKEPFERDVDIKLPVKPYTLGAWLGDGRNCNPDVCCAPIDKCVIDSIVADGYEIAWHTTHKDTGVLYFGFKNLRQGLQSVGMCHSRRTTEKHIPDVYLTASKRQRLELLSGLLDTDGCCSKSEHKYHFSTTSEGLRDSFIALVSTFGWRVCLTESMPRPHKIQSGHEIVGRKMCYTIGFSPTEEIPCRVERKHLREFSKQRKIAIKSVRKVEPKRGNCIQVEGGIYCVGKTMLPTHNSTLEIFLLSGVIGWFPDMPNLASSFSGTMTKSLYDGVNQILTDVDEYAWHEIFPDVTFKAREGTNSKDQTINVGKRKRFKSLTCRAINASLTGNTRCEYLLCADDLVSGIEEALNKERLEKLWQTYNTDLKTRKKQGCKELHICTRWSTLDPVGRLKMINADNPRARFLVVPALNENGESNFEYDGGVGFDTAYFNDIKKSMDDISFKCLFMGEPVEREGLLYHDDELQRYLDLPLQEPDAVLSIVDTKNKGTDYFVQPVLLQYGDKYYCTDCICSDDSDYERQYARSTNLILTNKVEACQFESNNGGDRIALEVSKRVKEAKGYCNITQSFTTQNKETKIIVYAPWVKEHIIFRDRSMYNPNDDYGKMMSFLLGYSPMGKNKHDDVPDAFSSFAKWKNRPETPPTVVGRRPF